MAEPAPRAELLKSLGRLVRGLSSLFWGLPISLICCVWTAYPQWVSPVRIIPPLAATGLLLYGLWQLSGFQKQERIWRKALDQATVLALINFGLSPFVYWWSRLPFNGFFFAMVGILAVSGVLFLASLNVVLKRLGAMLPDEALRVETSQFTSFNLMLIVGTLVVGVVTLLVSHPQVVQLWMKPLSLAMQRQTVPFWVQNTAALFAHFGPWFLLLLILLPLAMTMALLWKTKEVILENVFGAEN